jgi:hypothetical protein
VQDHRSTQNDLRTGQNSTCYMSYKSAWRLASADYGNYGLRARFRLLFLKSCGKCAVQCMVCTTLTERPSQQSAKSKCSDRPAISVISVNAGNASRAQFRFNEEIQKHVDISPSNDGFKPILPADFFCRNTNGTCRRELSCCSR